MLTYNVISHTHWDREWYFSFDKFRIRLVDMMDHVLEILDRDKAYIFHFDAQTVVLEDYLEIRPYNKGLIEKYVKQGRLIIGPWYVQNDFYLTSGEATIRNLLIGSKMAEDYGACGRIGYAPDQFGNISQLPQILQGFGVDNFIFGRGYQHMDWKDQEWVLRDYNSEFLWEGPDGTKLTAIYLRHWYNNAQRFSSDTEKAMALVNANKESFEGNLGSDQMLMMNGVDHLEAQEDLLPILEAINDKLPQGENISQTTMEAYVRQVQNYYEKHPEVQIDVWKGELRTGLITNILQNTLSSRIYLKTKNNELQNMLEHKIERLYSLIGMYSGSDTYPKDYMHWLWKELIKNHAHDSICGCSSDLVHDNMEDRFKRIAETVNVLIDRGMAFLGDHIGRLDFDEEDVMILVVNPHQKPMSQPIEVEIDFLLEESVEGFKIQDQQGNQIPFTVTGVREGNKNVYSPINLPGVKEVKTFTIELMASDVPSIGFVVLRVIKDLEPIKINLQESELVEQGALINEYIAVSISDEGIISMTDLACKNHYTNFLTLIDEGNVGDNYRQRSPRNDRVIDFTDLIPTIHKIKATPRETAYRISYYPELPIAYDFDLDIRSEETIICPVHMTLSLSQDSKWLEVDLSIDNRVVDHRLRVCINTGVPSEISYGSIPFDLIDHSRQTMVDEVNNDDQANSGFIAMCDSTSGMAIFNKGIYEYEHLSGQEAGTIALTVLSATGYIQRKYDSLGEINPQVIAPGGNCLREVHVSFALCPMNSKTSMEKAYLMSELYQTPLMTIVQPVDQRKFNGGRPAVQGSSVSDIFYRKDTLPNMRLSGIGEGVKIEGKGIILSALKAAEDGNGWVVRLYNITDEDQACRVSFCKEISEASLVSLEEKEHSPLRHQGKTLEKITFRPKAIKTIRYQLKR